MSDNHNNGKVIEGEVISSSTSDYQAKNNSFTSNDGSSTSQKTFTASKENSTKLNWRFVIKHPARIIACGFGSGLFPVAPGTAGTVFAWITFSYLYPLFTLTNWLIFLSISCLAGMVVIHKAGKDFADPDHKSIVWDEIVPFWLVLTLCPDTFKWQLIAFILFRYFDITKPQPAKFFDEKMKNGFGVMADDLVAAAYSLLVLAILFKIF